MTDDGLPTNPDDDFFEIRTFDTGSFEAVAPENDFTATAVEPETVSQPPPRRPVSGSAARRARRARASRPERPPSLWWSTLRSLVVAALAAVLVSTIFSLWTRPTFFSDEFRAGLNRVQATQRVINIQPTPLPTDVREIRIGIVAGHSGQPRDTSFEVDPGAVCPDGLTELEINRAVAQRVVALLSSDFYSVDLIDEFDPVLQGYQADVLLSIHTNDCQDYGAAGTGFSVASASSRQTTRGADEYLQRCLITQYGQTTNLPHHGEVTYDMTDYHTFGEVAVDTPTAIIEIGFMFNDRAILTGSPDLIAQGIANGIRCFLRPELYGRF